MVYQSLQRENWNPREVLGRYVFSEPLARVATLRQLAEKIEQEFAIDRKNQGQFTFLAGVGSFPAHNWNPTSAFGEWRGPLVRTW